MYVKYIVYKGGIFMKKRLFSTMCALITAVGVVMVAAGCEKGDEGSSVSEHTHAYATEWSTDETHHWKAAICEHTTEVSEKSEHSYGADGKCIACQKAKPVVNTVSQEEWVALFNGLIDGINHSATATVTMDQGQVTMGYKVEDNVRYMEQSVGTDAMKQYVSFNDDTSSFTIYIYDTNNGWVSTTSTYDDAAQYANQKFQLSFIAALFPTMSATEKGEKLYITELYSAFTYSEGKYSATLYDAGETAHKTTFTFENGKLVLGEVVAATGTAVFTFAYDNVEVVIPQEVLDAPSQN